MKMVVLDGYALNPGDISWEALQAMGELVVYDRTADNQIRERAAGATILFTNKTPITASTIQSLPALRYIGVLATGYNVVDVGAAQKAGILVANVPGYGTASVVQLTFALLLELTLHTRQHSDAVKQGRWSQSADWCFWDYPLVELSGKTMGIIGFGRIGQEVANVAAAFGMQVIASSRTQPDQRHRNNFQWATTNALLERADVVSIHCPLFPETHGLINQNSLQRMKPTAFLLNTSRGPIIVEADLAAALNNDRIAGAGIDVLSVEPPHPDNPLLTAKNCIITPHIAWATQEARMRLIAMTVQNLKAYLMGAPINIVNT